MTTSTQTVACPGRQCGVENHIAGSAAHKACQKQSQQNNPRTPHNATSEHAMSDFNYENSAIGREELRQRALGQQSDSTQSNVMRGAKQISMRVAISSSPRLRRIAKQMEKERNEAFNEAEQTRQEYIEAKIEHAQALSEYHDAIEEMDKMPAGNGAEKTFLYREAAGKMLAAERIFNSFQSKAYAAERKAYDLTRRYNRFAGRELNRDYGSFDDHVSKHGYYADQDD